MASVTYNTTASGAQGGYEDSATGWVTSTPAALRLLTDDDWLGFVFNLSSTLSDTVNRPVFGGTFSLALELTTVTQDPANKTFGGLYFYENLTTELFSASFLPSTGMVRRQLATLAAGDLIAGTNTISLDQTAGAFQENIKKLLGLLAHTQWNGLLAMAIGPLSGAAGQVNSPISSDVLTTQETAFHTGHNIGGVMRRGRARHDARSGLPANTADLIEDGYIEGIHVSEGWWEPEDRSGLDVRVPATEGEVDDKNTGAS